MFHGMKSWICSDVHRKSFAAGLPGKFMCRAFVFFLLAASCSDADVLILKNGNQMEGFITEETPDAVCFEEVGIKVWIKKSSIDTVRPSSVGNRAKQIKKLNAPPPPRESMYPREAEHILASLDELDARKARRKQLIESVRKQVGVNKSLEQKMAAARSELNSISQELDVLRPSDERNQFGARPPGYREKVRAYNKKFLAYQALLGEWTALSTEQLDRDKKLAEDSRKLAEASGQYAEIRNRTKGEWNALQLHFPPEQLEGSEWVSAIDRRLQDHADFRPLDPSKAIEVRKTDEGVQLMVRADRQGQFVIPIVLNGKTGANVIVDTGATVTLVTKKVADLAGLTLSGESFEASLADGKKIKVRRAVADSMRIFGVMYAGEKIGVIENGGGENFDGLLGMSFLKKVPFTIRNRTLMMTL